MINGAAQSQSTQSPAPTSQKQRENRMDDNTNMGQNVANMRMQSFLLDQGLSFQAMQHMMAQQQQQQQLQYQLQCQQQQQQLQLAPQLNPIRTVSVSTSTSTEKHYIEHIEQQQQLCANQIHPNLNLNLNLNSMWNYQANPANASADVTSQTLQLSTEKHPHPVKQSQQPVQVQADTMWTYQTNPSLVSSLPVDNTITSTFKTVSTEKYQFGQQPGQVQAHTMLAYQENHTPETSLPAEDSFYKLVPSNMLPTFGETFGEMRTVTSQGMLLPLVQMPNCEKSQHDENPKEQMQECMNTIEEALQEPSLAEAGKVLLHAMQASSSYMSGIMESEKRFSLPVPASCSPDKRFFLNAPVQSREGNVVFPELPAWKPTQVDTEQHQVTPQSIDLIPYLPHQAPAQAQPQPAPAPVLSSTLPQKTQAQTSKIVHSKPKVQKASCGRVEKKTKPLRTPFDGSPHKYLLAALRERGYSTVPIASHEAGYHTDPTSLQLASFGTRLIQAVNGSDTEALSKLLGCGLSPNPCNQFGDTTLSLICKRADYGVFKVLVDHGCDLQVCDSFGRTALHNLAWAGKFSAPMTKVILDGDLNQILIADKRGQCPLEYVQRGKWGEWIAFLKEHMDMYWPVSRDRPTRPLPRESRMGPVADPMSAVSSDLAVKISSGEISPDEAMRLKQGYM